MITSRKTAIATIVCMCLSLFLCGFIVYGAHNIDTPKTAAYEKMLFGDKVITLDIRTEEDNWQYFLDNVQDKEWIAADMVINGEFFSTVGIRPKGNSTIRMVPSPANREADVMYSLHIKMNKYVKGQTYYGLDTFCVNNMLADTTYMKDYLSYDIMRYIGVDAPLMNFANITVNGEDYGFGIALERYDQAYLDRVYSTTAGQLYNVKVLMSERVAFEAAWQDAENDAVGGPGGAGAPEGGAGQGGGFGQGAGFGGFREQPGGGSLLYTGDSIGNYPCIFNSVIFSNNTDEDKQRVITAIKYLNEGTDLEQYIDVDAALRYFAAHNTVVNLDSYSTTLQQNYYLYERDGKLTILPWDYGLAFGGFLSNSTLNVINFPIDTPVSGISMESRPLLDKLFAVEEYRERYHGYLWEIVEGYFESGRYLQTIRDLDSKISAYVKNSASTFVTHEQYQASLPHLAELGRLRAVSIRRQLDGTIP
ncbi:MAG: CotH kinase family protein, partial [Clostridiales bacterium]|nr:CotH kinase family protein [Clostridiales bacterium]